MEARKFNLNYWYSDFKGRITRCKKIPEIKKNLLTVSGEIF